MRQTAFVFLLTTLVVCFQNCQDYKFSGADAAKSTDPGLTDSGDRKDPDDGDPDGGSIPNDGLPPGSMVMVKMVPITCTTQKYCVMEYHLVTKLSQDFEFDWETDDEAHTRAPAGGAAVAQAGVHYVSALGHVKFAAGELKASVQVENLNKSGSRVEIPLMMYTCTLGGASIGGCKGHFTY